MEIVDEDHRGVSLPNGLRQGALEGSVEPYGMGSIPALVTAAHLLPMLCSLEQQHRRGQVQQHDTGSPGS